MGSNDSDSFQVHSLMAEIHNNRLFQSKSVSHNSMIHNSMIQRPKNKKPAVPKLNVSKTKEEAELKFEEPSSLNMESRSSSSIIVALGD